MNELKKKNQLHINVKQNNNDMNVAKTFKKEKMNK